jgi:outer membrane lipoprotein-sorting protein
MKKTILGMLAGAALTLFTASCGEKLLTQEQFDAEIAKGVEAGRAGVESEMNAKCDAEFETRVQERVLQLDQEAAAAQPQVQ